MSDERVDLDFAVFDRTWNIALQSGKHRLNVVPVPVPGLAERREDVAELVDYFIERISARAVVLATGRFSGHGLTADRQSVRESILGLPVQQPGGRDAWHQDDFLDPAGHAINRAGLRTDEVWRPLDATGKPAWKSLFAIGSILADQDWMRAKCGSGLAIATAWAAIEQVAQPLRETQAP